jgi:phage terminase small subunit
MSKLLAPRQEAFVLAYIKMGSASEAYRQAYNTNASAKTIHEKASRLLAEGNVRARFEVLRGKVMERAVEKTAISKAWEKIGRDKKPCTSRRAPVGYQRSARWVVFSPN